MNFLLNAIKDGFFLEFSDLWFSLAILLTVFTVVYKNPVVSVLFLIFLFLDIAVILITSGLDYIGLSYILVYVGAISILFIFIVMFIDIRISELLDEVYNNRPLTLLIILFFFELITLVLPGSDYLQNGFISFELHLWRTLYYASSYGWDNFLIYVLDISNIGNVMYTSHLIWLIVISIILLMSMVGAIVLTLKKNN